MYWHWISPKHVSGKSFVFIRKLSDWSDMPIGWKVVWYISSSFWRMKINEKFFCTVITFTSFTNYNFYSIAPLSFLTSKTLLLFFLPKSYFWMLSSTFNFFIDILFRIIIVCKCYTTFNVLLLFSNDRWVCDFSLCPRVSGVFFQRPW